MSNQAIDEDLLRQWENLGPDERRQVLDFARLLAIRGQKARGTPGSTLTRFAGGIDRVDLDLIASGVESGCEQVSSDEW